MENYLYFFPRKWILYSTNGCQRTHKWKRQLFPAAGTLEFVDIDILGLLLRATTVNQHVVKTTDKFSKLTQGMPMAKIISMQNRQYSWKIKSCHMESFHTF